MNSVFSSRKYFNHRSDRLVSVIVVAHENPEFLLQCLNSILAQSYALFECIVVLDNDANHVLQKSVQANFEHDARFSFVGLSRKRERNYCRNLGIELSTGRWVTIVDGDDTLPEHSLAIRVRAATENRNDIVFGRMQIKSDNGSVETIKNSETYTFKDLRISWPTHCTLLIDRKHLADTRYPASITDCDTDASLIAGEDVLFMFELLRRQPNCRFLNCRKHVYTYRRHLSSSYKKRYASIKQVINIIKQFHGEPGDDDLPYKNTMIERSLGYMFWLGFALWNERRISDLPQEADKNIFEFCMQTSSTQMEKAETRFLEDMEKLAVISPAETGELVAAVKQILNGTVKEKHTTTLSSGMPGRSHTSYDPKKMDFTRLNRWKNFHRGENCMLMCNGPSLNKVDFSKIDTSKYVLFGLNKIFLGFSSLGISPKYIAAVNAKVLEQSIDTYQNLDVVKFISNRMSSSRLPQSPFTYYINSANLPSSSDRFCTDITKYVYEGWTVTHVALQIIYYMGFSNVYIVGMDHRFSQHIEGQENKPSIIHGEDIDHFHPSYFGQGKSWDLPDLVNSEISYKCALKAFSEAGKGIFDCTINGACTIFPKLDISSIYSSSKKTSTPSLIKSEQITTPKAVTSAPTSAQRICFFPAFSSEDDINFSMIRASWYLSCIQGAEISVYADHFSESLDCYDYYDPDCISAFEDLRTSGRLIAKPYLKPQELIPTLNESNIIICWKDHGYIEDLLGRDVLGKLANKGKKIYRVGASSPSESSIYIEISKDLSAFKPDLISECQKKFEQLLRRHGEKKDAYLFATGPSSQAYQKYQYGGNESVRIICNSVINDEEMLEYVQPDILVFADPIFHFGCSTYAKAFREQLLKVCAIYHFDIIIPIKYYPIFTYHMPELRDRLIGVPHYKEKGINLDLGKDFFMNTMSNILTYLMLPVGASIAKNLYVIGCDGRPLEEDDYFWGHNDKTQFSGEMAAIQKAHPSFFKVDYNEYYLAHCQHLEDYASKLEANNQHLYSMWGSHIPALIKRLHIPHDIVTDRVIISINPDLRSNFGHWAHYDRRLAETTDDLFLTLANKKLSINPVEFFAVPAFDEDVFAIKNRYSRDLKKRLANQLGEMIGRLFGTIDKNVQLNLIMYSGDITFVDVLDTIFTDLSINVVLSLNLFYSHFDYDVGSDSFIRHKELYDKILSAEYLKQRPWLKLFVDSERMQSILSKKFEIDFGLWPMVNLDFNRSVIENIGPKPEASERLVVFPGNGQIAKGFDIACDFILKYGQQLSQRYNCHFVLRNMLRDSIPNNEILEQKLIQVSDFAFVDVQQGTLSEEDYLKLFYHSDLIVLPYRKSSFFSRTSSCVVNAILSGTPALVTADTWLSDQIERFNAGLGFTDGDIDSMFIEFCKLLDEHRPVERHEEAIRHYDSRNILSTIL